MYAENRESFAQKQSFPKGGSFHEKFKMKHAALICMVLLAIHIWFPYAASPYQYILKSDDIDRRVPTETLLYEEEVDSGIYLLFCADEDAESVSCFTLKKVLWSYRLCGVGYVFIESPPDREARFYGYSFGPSSDPYWMDWGVVYDPTIQSISCNGTPGLIVETSNDYRLYYSYFLVSGIPTPPKHAITYDKE